jgi:hypothetical protein
MSTSVHVGGGGGGSLGMVVTSHMTSKTAITDTSVYLHVLRMHDIMSAVNPHVVSVRYPLESYASFCISASNVAFKHLYPSYSQLSGGWGVSVSHLRTAEMWERTVLAVLPSGCEQCLIEASKQSSASVAIWQYCL